MSLTLSRLPLVIKAIQEPRIKDKQLCEHLVALAAFCTKEPNRIAFREARGLQIILQRRLGTSSALVTTAVLQVILMFAAEEQYRSELIESYELVVQLVAQMRVLVFQGLPEGTTMDELDLMAPGPPFDARQAQNIQGHILVLCCLAQDSRGRKELYFGGGSNLMFVVAQRAKLFVELKLNALSCISFMLDSTEACADFCKKSSREQKLSHLFALIRGQSLGMVKTLEQHRDRFGSAQMLGDCLRRVAEKQKLHGDLMDAGAVELLIRCFQTFVTEATEAGLEGQAFEAAGPVLAMYCRVLMNLVVSEQGRSQMCTNEHIDVLWTALKVVCHPQVQVLLMKLLSFLAQHSDVGNLNERFVPFFCSILRRYEQKTIPDGDAPVLEQVIGMLLKVDDPSVVQDRSEFFVNWTIEQLRHDASGSVRGVLLSKMIQLMCTFGTKCGDLDLLFGKVVPEMVSVLLKRDEAQLRLVCVQGLLDLMGEVHEALGVRFRTRIVATMLEMGLLGKFSLFFRDLIHSGEEPLTLTSFRLHSVLLQLLIEMMEEDRAVSPQCFTQTGIAVCVVKVAELVRSMVDCIDSSKMKLTAVTLMETEARALKILSSLASLHAEETMSVLLEDLDSLVGSLLSALASAKDVEMLKQTSSLALFLALEDRSHLAFAFVRKEDDGSLLLFPAMFKAWTQLRLLESSGSLKKTAVSPIWASLCHTMYDVLLSVSPDSPDFIEDDPSHAVNVVRAICEHLEEESNSSVADDAVILAECACLWRLSTLPVLAMEMRQPLFLRALGKLLRSMVLPEISLTIVGVLANLVEHPSIQLHILQDVPLVESLVAKALEVDVGETTLLFLYGMIHALCIDAPMGIPHANAAMLDTISRSKGRLREVIPAVLPRIAAREGYAPFEGSVLKPEVLALLKGLTPVRLSSLLDACRDIVAQRRKYPAGLISEASFQAISQARIDGEAKEDTVLGKVDQHLEAIMLGEQSFDLKYE